jgi:hypothetical protein
VPHSSWREYRSAVHENHDQYKYYGGRGIVVCGEWRNPYSAANVEFFSLASTRFCSSMKVSALRLDFDPCSLPARLAMTISSR